jgi:hypothetical protein
MGDCVGDCCSTHGTQLNGRLLNPGVWYPLHAGDMICIADFLLRIEAITAELSEAKEARDDAAIDMEGAVSAAAV